MRALVGVIRVHFKLSRGFIAESHEVDSAFWRTTRRVACSRLAYENFHIYYMRQFEMHLCNYTCNYFWVLMNNFLILSISNPPSVLAPRDFKSL